MEGKERKERSKQGGGILKENMYWLLNKTIIDWWKSILHTEYLLKL